MKELLPRCHQEIKKVQLHDYAVRCAPCIVLGYMAIRRQLKGAVIQARPATQGVAQS